MIGDMGELAQRIKEDLAKSMSGKRFTHVLGTAETAYQIAILQGIDPQKARIAALLHDIAREWPLERQRQYLTQTGGSFEIWELERSELIHSHVGAYWASITYGIQDDEIIKAIKFHTVGHPQMGILEKTIYVADKIEPNRTYPGVESIRQLVVKSLDFAVLACLDQTIKYVLRKKIWLHPLAVETRNHLLITTKNAMN